MRFLVLTGILCAAVWAQADSAQGLREQAAQHRLAGRLEAAEPLLERLAALDASGANLEDLARVEVALGKLDRAEDLYRRAAETRMAAREPREAVIPVMHRHIEVLASLGRFDEAEREASDAYYYGRPSYVPSGETAAADLAVLAKLYQQQKEWPSATATWRRALQFQQEAWGIDDGRLAATLDSLATVHQRAAELEQAEPLLRRAVAIRQANRGPASAEVAQTLDQLGEVLYALERFTDAEVVFERALVIWTALLGPDNSMLALNYDNLAVTKAQLGKYDEAETLYLESLKLRDADDIRSLRSLAVVRAAQEDYSDAEPLYRRAAAMAEEPQNRSPEELAALLTDYADLLRKMNRLTEARRVEARIAALTSGAPKGKAAPVAGKAK